MNTNASSPSFDDLKGSPLHDQLTGKAGLKNETHEPEYKVGRLPPKVRTHIQPEGGWKEQTYYVVEVAARSTNPIHRSILYVGFLNGRKDYPLGGAYCAIMNAVYKGNEPPEAFFYIKPICEIAELSKEARGGF